MRLKGKKNLPLVRRSIAELSLSWLLRVSWALESRSLITLASIVDKALPNASLRLLLDSDSDSWGLFSLEPGFSPVETDGSIYDASQQESPFPVLCFSGVEFLSRGKEMAFMRELDFRMGFFLSIWSGPLEVLNLLILPEIR